MIDFIGRSRLKTSTHLEIGKKEEKVDDMLAATVLDISDRKKIRRAT